MVGFKPGDMILISKPYAYVLYNKFRGLRCDFCLQKQSALKQCGRCHFVYYCNKFCQVKAWQDHKMECKFLKKCKDIPDQNVRYISLIILKLKKYGSSEPFEEVHGRKVTFGTLMSHSEEIKKSDELSQKGRFQMNHVQKFIGSENMPSEEEFFEIFGKITINDFCISEAILGIGCGLYLGASVFDHSCDPNAEPVFCGADLWVRAKKYIRNEDISQVRITYVDELELPAVRQQNLMGQYFFHCQCNRCTDKDLEKKMTKLLVTGEDTELYLTEINDSLEFLDLHKEMQDHAAPGSSSFESCAILDELEDLIGENRLADTHISKIKVLNELYNACMKSGHRRKALEYGLQLIEPYRLYLGPCHSTLGYHLYEISGLLFGEGKWNKYSGPRREAKKILKVTMGEEHPMYKLFFET